MRNKSLQIPDVQRALRHIHRSSLGGYTLDGPYVARPAGRIRRWLGKFFRAGV